LNHFFLNQPKTHSKCNTNSHSSHNTSQPLNRAIHSRSKPSSLLGKAEKAQV
jgi:hypothetical protein